MITTEWCGAMAITNEAIYKLINEKVMVELSGINAHLATLNGQVKHLQECQAEHSEAITAHATQLAVHDTTLAVMSAVETERLKRIDERHSRHEKDLGSVRANAKEIMARVWDVSKQVAEVAAVVAVLTKLAGVW